MNPGNEHELKLAQLLRQADESNNGANRLNAELDFLASSASLSEGDRQKLLKAHRALEALKGLDPNGEQSRETLRVPVTEVSNTDRDFRMGLSEALPDRLGRFEIVRELGRGGFAVVLLARDPNLGRPVALKIPQPHALFSSESRERFLREARLAASLSHPAIVPVFESGKIGSLTYIASEFCPGTTLAKWLSERTAPVQPHRAAGLVCRLADAVQHAHSRGVIHRDLKPGNVLLDHREDVMESDQDLIQSLRISDFGLAKLYLEDSDLSRSEALIGTPAYMSPEQAAGRSDVGPASDVYALGAILYELLVGKPPHRKKTYLATLQALECETPVPPRKIDAAIPPDLEAICLKCLEKNPDNRYTSAWDLQQDLGRFLSGESVQARPISRIEKLTRWSRRNPAIATLSMVAFMSLTAGCGIATWQWWRAETNLAETQVQSDRATRHLNRLEHSIDRILNDVSRFLTEVPQSEALQDELLQEALRLQEELLAEESNDSLVTFRTCQARRRTAELYLQMGNVPSAISSLQAAEELLENIDASQMESEKLSEQMQLGLLLSNAWCRKGQGANAVAAARKAVDACRQFRVLRPGPTAAGELANALRQLGVSLELAGDFQQSGDHFREAVDLFRSPEMQRDLENCPEADRSQIEVNLAQCLNSLGIFEKSSGLVEMAEKRYRQSIELFQSVADRHPSRIDLQNQLATTTLNLGNLLFAQHRFDESEVLYQRSVNISRQMCSDFPQTVRYRVLNLAARTGLGLAQRRLNRIDEAIATLSEAIRDTETDLQAVGSNPDILSNLAKLHNNLASIQLDVLNDDQAGEASLRHSVAICETLLEANPSSASSRLSLSIANSRLASVLARKGDYSEAMSLIDSAIVDAKHLIERNIRDPRHVNNLRWNLAARAKMLAQSGDDPSAIETAEEITKIIPENSELWIKAAEALGQCVHALQSDPEYIPRTEEQLDAYRVAALRFLETAHQLGGPDVTKLLASPPLTVFQERQRGHSP